jgi:GT2 family glycosyltransferase
VSVVAVSWNTLSCLPSALDSVLAGSGSLEVEAIVVDNGSTDGSVQALRARGDVHLVALGENTGFTRGANVGADRATGRYLLFLNPDVVAPLGALEQLVEELESHPGAWAAAPRFVNPDGTPQPFWRRRPGPLLLALCFTHRGRRIDRLIGGRARNRLQYADLAPGVGSVPIESVGAAFLLVRREEFERAGRFDERFFNFFQDTALQRHMARAGRTLLGVRDVEVVHQLGVTFRTLPPSDVHGQLLYAARQYLADEPWFRRWTFELFVRLEVLGPGGHRAAVRRVALAPLARGVNS